MRKRTTLVSIGTVLPAVALMVHGCREATQVTLEIGTNVVCADLRGVEIVVASDPRQAEHRAALDAPGTRFATATTTECAEGPVPRRVGTLVVTPAGGDGAVVVVAAFGGTRTEECMAPRFGAGCIVARRKFSFVDHTPVRLPIVLDPVCAGVPCDENSTCVGAKCVDSKVDCGSGTCSAPGQLLADGGVVVVDATSPLDGALVDATSEAGDDAGATDGAVADASVDAGGGYCPQNPVCLGSTACISFPGDNICCYATDPASCAPARECAAMSGCCRRSEDCNAGDVCCASTAVQTANTIVSCRSPSACSAIGGAAVCDTVGNTGCAPGRSCIGAAYSSMPQYFSCS